MSPNRLNLRFSVQKVKKEQHLKKLDWLVDLVKKEGINTPKTIVFCNTMNEIAIVVNYLMSQLGKKVFCPNYSSVKDNCLIGIYHSNSWQSSKDRVMEQFKSGGVKRVDQNRQSLYPTGSKNHTSYPWGRHLHIRQI